MKTITLAFLLGVAVAGCGGEPASATHCDGKGAAIDPDSGWSCKNVSQLGLWNCTCEGPGSADQPVTDALCTQAKTCEN